MFKVPVTSPAPFVERTAGSTIPDNAHLFVTNPRALLDSSNEVRDNPNNDRNADHNGHDRSKDHRDHTLPAAFRNDKMI